MIKTSEIMKRYIHVQKADREFIMKAFGVTEQMVSYALRYDAKRGNSDLAKRIRKLARERGGIAMVEAKEWEVLHDADGYIRCYLGDVLVELSKNEPIGDVYKDGKKVKHFERVIGVNEIESIKDWAAAL